MAWLGLVWFYGISTIVIYLMSNNLYIYIEYMICKHILLLTFLNAPELIFLHTAKEFQVMQFNANNSIWHYSFVCTQLNGFKYCHVSLTIQLNSHLLTHS